MSEGEFYALNQVSCAWGHLKNLDLADVSIPTGEIVRFLKVRYDKRHSVNAKVFEDVVGTVLEDHGFNVTVTSFSGDNGIDIFIAEHSAGSQIGVQVKRYRGKIEAEQIRSLAGALVLAGVTKGVFVTTSSFTKGADKTACAYGNLGLPIELIDAKRFYSLLELSRRKTYTSIDDPSSPFYRLVADRNSIPNFYMDKEYY